MRILVITDVPEFVTGGAEIQAARLIEYWLDAGHEVVCMGRRMGAGSTRIGKHVVKVHRIRTIARMGRWIRAGSYFVSLVWLLLRHRGWTDVVYTRFLGEAASTAAMLKAAGLLQAPLVATPASSSEGGDLEHIRSTPFGQSVIKLLSRHCDAINLIAPSMDGELRRAGFSGSNFTYIPNGVPVRELAEPQDDRPLRMISVGRLSRQKGFDVLLRALARARLPAGIQAWIVGDGPERTALHYLAEDLKIADRITWLGELPSDDVLRHLCNSRLFVLPSRYEGMSNAGLEAMERGLPLIITDCGGLDTYVTADMGWIVPVGDDVALATAIEAAISSGADTLTRMGQAGRAQIRLNFDIRVVALRYIELFERILCDKPTTTISH